MEFKIKDHELDWHYIRECVFVKEQGFQKEFDEIDNIAIHLCLYDGGKLIGCGRIYPKEHDEKVYMLGRLAILQPYRKSGFGFVLLSKLQELAKQQGACEIQLSAQCVAKGFYERAGYTASGEEYLDEHCPHITMKKQL